MMMTVQPLPPTNEMVVDDDVELPLVTTNSNNNNSNNVANVVTVVPPPPSHHLHDCLAQGAYELGLPPLSSLLLLRDNDDDQQQQQQQQQIMMEEIQRLPLLVRWWQECGPRVAVPPLDTTTTTNTTTTAKNEDKEENEHPPTTTTTTTWLDTIVQRIEERVAYYEVAESIIAQQQFVVQSPHASRRRLLLQSLSKLPPLQKQQQQRSSSSSSSSVFYGPESILEYDTGGLQSLLSSSSSDVVPTTTTQPRRGTAVVRHDDHRHDNLQGVPPDNAISTMTTTTTEDDEDDGDRTTRSRDTRTTYPVVVVEDDGMEYQMDQTVRELIQITLLRAIMSSTMHSSSHDDDDDATTTTHHHTVAVPRSTTIITPPSWEDSRLATRRLDDDNDDHHQYHSSSSSWDVAPTLAIILHAAPVLRHGHVATALCRAAFPQTPRYVAYLGANCPAAVSSLFHGCRSVVTAACDAERRQEAHDERSPYRNMIQVGIDSVRLLSRLSPREAHRILNLLRRRRRPTTYHSLSSSSPRKTTCSSRNSNSSGGGGGGGDMVPLQLELSMQHDPLLACFLLVEHLNDQSAVSVPLDGDDEDEDRGDHHGQHKATSYSALLNLRDYLGHHTESLSNVWNFLYRELLSLPLPIPRLSILLVAYVTFISKVQMHHFLQSPHTSGSGRTLMRSCRTKLREILMDRQRQCMGNTNNVSEPIRRVYDLLVVALISTDAVLSTSDAGTTDFDNDLSSILDRSTGAPTQSHQLLIRISLALQYGDAKSLCNIVEMTRLKQNHTPVATQEARLDSHLHNLLHEYCKRMLVHDGGVDRDAFDGDVSTSNTFDIILSPSIALQLMNCVGIPLLRKIDVSTSFLKSVLCSQHGAASHIQDPQIVDFMEQATAIVLANSETKLPLIMPLQVETMLIKSKSLFNRGDASAQLLLQLLYCLMFSQHEPKSPFRLDPRILPLHLLYELCEKSGMLSLMHESVATKLKYYIDLCCPDVPSGHQYRMLKSRERLYSSLDSSLLENKTKFAFLGCIRILVTRPHADLCELLVEQAYIEASIHLSESELISACASAFISCPSAPPIYFTFPMLYRDPLIMLKCPSSIWKRRGTRRIAIAILSRLLDIHEVELNNQSTSEYVAAELLSSRNAIILTCLLRMASSSTTAKSGEHQQCGMTLGLIRKLVASHPGLIALMIKQRLDESTIDWMIESVPEIAVDLRTLRGLLADHSSLTAAERLTVADYNIRIAIVHGNRNVDIALSIAVACLSQLLTSFFLILGPIGVPVNALITDGDELDATQVSRKAAFRLLQALQMILPFQTHFKNDVLILLQKFASMCKSEAIASGLPTAIATRQKNLLKKLLDCVGKVNDSMNVINKTK